MKGLMSWHLQKINYIICARNPTRNLILVLPRAYYNISMAAEGYSMTFRSQNNSGAILE